MGMASDRVRKAREKDAAMRVLAAAEKRAEKKAEAGEALRYEAADIRRQALTAARATGVTVAELAEELGVSVQRVYQLLNGS
jgi:transcriptional regulator with XRE-family HTH domain